MSTQNNPQNRLTFLVKDAEGGVISVNSIPRECVQEVIYNVLEHKLLLRIKSIRGEGTTDVEPVQNVQVSSIDGKPTKKTVNSYTVRELYNMSVSNNIVTIADENDIKRVWAWLGYDDACDPDTLVGYREAHLKKVEEAKAKKTQEAAEKEASAEVPTPTILGADGTPARKDEVTTDNNPKQEAPVIAIQS